MAFFLLTPDPWSLTPSLWTLTPAHAQSWLDIQVPKSKPEPTKDVLARGKAVYNFRCYFCHGVNGEGDGPIAKYLEPRPRDFTLGLFKLRTTRSGELPTDEDLFRTITRGIPGTAMPSWAPLPEEDRWAVIHYVKSLSEFFGDPSFSPYREEDGRRYIVEIAAPPKPSEQTLNLGKEAYQKAKCWECHGDRGLGNGKAAGRQFDTWENRIWPRDLSKGWLYKGGTDAKDVFRTFTVGMNGTPMPSFVDALAQGEPEKDERMRWALAQYVTTRIEEKEIFSEAALRVRRLDEPLPLDPVDRLWDEADEIAVRLFGQVTRRPRWQTPAVDAVRVRALYNEKEIAFRLAYHDRTESMAREDPEIWSAETTYPEIDLKEFPHKKVKYRDAVALWFPVKKPSGPERPYFLYGDAGRPVTIWKWTADTNSVEELNARGPEKIQPQPPEDGQATGGGVYEDGEWRVVIKRTLVTENAKSDFQFIPGDPIPFVLAVWDGGNGESGLQHAISSWHEARLEAPIRKGVYAYSLLAALLTGAFGIYLTVRAGASDRRKEN